MLLAVVGLFTGISFANQITISNSTNGAIDFSGPNPTAVIFSGVVSGFGLYGSTLGTYKLKETGSGNPTLTNQVFDIYSVNMGSSVINFSFVLMDNAHSTITGTVDLETLIGGSTRAPEFIGTFTPVTETGVFIGAGYPIGSHLAMDLTVSLHSKTTTVNDVYAGLSSSVSGPISSGEIPAVPEPTTLGLLGSGLLTVAGLLKRRMF
jgi:hypothetical protein